MQQFISTLLQAIQKIGQHIKPIRNFYKIFQIHQTTVNTLNGSNVTLVGQLVAQYDIPDYINLGSTNGDINFAVQKPGNSLIKLKCSVNFIGLQNTIFIGVEFSGVGGGAFIRKYAITPILNPGNGTWDASVSFCEIFPVAQGDHIAIQLYDSYNNNNQAFDITDGCVEVELKNLM